jgi:hypothetical protein
MGKAFGLLLIVLGIWVGMELYTVGTQRAFGGVFVDLGLAQAPAAGEAPDEAPLDAIRSRAQQNADRAASRGQGQLESAPD